MQSMLDKIQMSNNKSFHKSFKILIHLRQELNKKYWHRILTKLTRKLATWRINNKLLKLSSKDT